MIATASTSLICVRRLTTSAAPTKFIKETVAHGGNVLFVGTKRQAQRPIREQAERVGMPCVNERWLGGMLTNFSTVNARIQRLKELSSSLTLTTSQALAAPEKELLMMRREKGLSAPSAASATTGSLRYLDRGHQQEAPRCRRSTQAQHGRARSSTPTAIPTTSNTVSPVTTTRFVHRDPHPRGCRRRR